MNNIRGQFYISNNQVIETKDYKEISSGKSQIVYEVLRVIEGKPLFCESHLKRLEKTVTLMLEDEEAARVNKRFDYAYILDGIMKLIKENGNTDGNIKILLDISNMVVDMFYIPHSYPTESDYKNGIDTITINIERNNPHAKRVDSNYKEYVNKAIKENDVYEALLVDENGGVTEGSRSNIFFVKDGIVIVPPSGKALLGITREKVLEAIDEEGIRIEEREVNKTELLEEIDGVFLTGTSPKVLPIKKVDDRVFESSSNKIINEIMISFDKKIREDIVRFK